MLPFHRCEFRIVALDMVSQWTCANSVCCQYTIVWTRGAISRDVIDHGKLHAVHTMIEQCRPRTIDHTPARQSARWPKLEPIGRNAASGTQARLRAIVVVGVIKECKPNPSCVDRLRVAQWFARAHASQHINPNRIAPCRVLSRAQYTTTTAQLFR